MERRISLATTQLNAAQAPLADRLARAENLVTQAARAGAQLIALPELFNTGYAYRDENFAQAETADGPTAQWMKQTSARLGVHLAGSLLLRDGQDIYNALLLYAPDGRVWRYDKNYPWGWERAYFRERRAVTIAETDLGSIGLLLCWDIAHADLWQQYAGKVDLMLACSCPPNFSDPVYHFPNGSQVTGAQMGPVIRSMRGAELKVFKDTSAQQTAWLGVPFIGSTACGNIQTPLPNPLGSFLGFVPAAPWLIRHLPQVRHMEASVKLVEAACILAADGRQLAGLCNEQGEAFALAEVTIPAERPQPREQQPKPPVSQIMYFISDNFLTAVSLGTYAHGK
ncbi:MAG TPA: carbon-nitrogen hydrolase family protein [Anaerolineales bacterium]|nr:carbon-nitrogen hydrolase family protein [Anaerolineales bacterium]